MALKKSELYSKIWKSCDELRGGMDASQYKDYVLALLFMKYVTDKYYGKDNALIEIPEGASFHDMVALKGDTEIGDKINKIIGKLAEANDLRGIIDVADFNDSDKLGSGKEMQERLSNLVGIFEGDGLDFSKNRAADDDLLGDAYEYLMRNFATESGKSKGQFYTPSEVSRIMAKVIGIEKTVSSDQTIYDPTCGSGSLLLKASDEAPVEQMSLYGQEMDNATRALAVMNMWLHGNETAEIWKDNTIANPHFKEKDGSLKKFDFAVANPPFSTKAWMSGFDPLNDEYKRFDGYGIPPAKNGDYAFLLHLIKSLKSNGKGAIILPHGVLFRGNAEAEIRKNIIERGYIKGIIGLPVNLFYGTGIPAAIIVIDKENAQNRKGIFMVDASKGFIKDGNKNRLREQDIHKIVDLFNNQIELPKYSRMISFDEISNEKNDFNLNIPRYIDSQEEEDLHDIEAHLLGGIPNFNIDELNNYWEVYPTLRNELFADADRKSYSNINVEMDNIKTAIFNNAEFVAYSKEAIKTFETWKEKHTPLLKNMAIGDKPKQIIFDLAEDILKSFAKKKLIDKYDVYQHLMNYWIDVMKDDVYMLVEDGWKVQIYLVKDKKGKQKDWGSDLVPKPLVINRYFKIEQEAINKLETKLENINQQLEDFKEEHTGEDGLLEEVINDKGNITKGDLTKRIKKIKNDTDFADELEVLNKHINFIKEEAELKAKIKKEEIELDKKLYAKYKALTEDEIKELVVDDKWMATIEQDVKSEMDRISQRLTGRIKELADRYDKTLPQLDNSVNKLATKVDAHLKTMGFTY